MAIVINMPRLSDTMEEGTVAKWLKQVGDKIEEGDILAEIETDKATMEFESFDEGTLLHIGIQEGDGAPVDTLLAIIGEKGEDISDLINGSGAAEADKSEEVKEENTAVEEVSNEESSEAADIPEGVEIIKMPRLSDTMEEGTVASWLKKVGDKVEEGDILAEIETDKATMEFESFYSGTLLYIGTQEGESSPVDVILAIIGPEGTDVDSLLKSKPSAPKKESAPKAEAKKEEAKKETVSSPNAAPVVSDGQRVFASPLAKKIASEKGVDLAKVAGSGDNGRIVKKDIENYTPSAAPSKAASNSATPVNVAVGEESFEEVKNNQMRKVIAKRLGESKFTAPHYYLNIEVDMSNAMQSRVQINSLPETKVSFNDMVVKACAMALKKHPQVNTTWSADSTRFNHHIHVGVAVAVEDGLVVPVLKFADQMGLSQIGGSVRELAGKARNKKLTPAEMDGSTFTVSNLGMFGIESFTSIINQPNSAILSVGAIIEKPVVKDGQIVVGNTMKLTLALDHRTVDGATGAQFLQTLRSYIENPVTMLA
ncbi:pyruvate dehydrogenase complex dihydrolipoamide acetyltransferase [Cellulophaga sp. HaHaR_3_176]|uniref:pyruvate dehydrogenase complex dihydrolipoamide acetyltransferase n=1 Tax=Cellulophaga sp. HaHaR_3_176 TaxID=1942464 RepID=UPI001C1F9547|nr:pyruvate dehydrogenase complex dihydrolipoamide acetyltransferase [Cellulophaga sp. HaHaR_3_176]QWX83055.1 pyruvate dehydrogenase complex dihydrolipoamide acetyltransferase [Cellulophaga sp. HaHaR_3_176]